MLAHASLQHRPSTYHASLVLYLSLSDAAYTGPTPSGWNSERTIHAIKLEPEAEEQTQSCACDLLFQHTVAYPEELPMVKLSNTRGLTNREVDVLSSLLVETAQENLGMASVFAIMQTAQEWMENKAGLQLGAHLLPPLLPLRPSWIHRHACGFDCIDTRVEHRW